MHWQGRTRGAKRSTREALQVRILFLDLDTLRPDHLRCYGYHRNTSSNIDRLAGEGLVFDNYYCSDAPCLPSRPALMSGQFGIHTSVVGHGGTAADMRLEGAGRDFQSRLASESLPAFLHSSGCKTATVSSFANRHSAWQFHAGFEETFNPGGTGMELAESITLAALRWIEQNAKLENWFLHVNYWDSHTPYRAPEAFWESVRGRAPAGVADGGSAGCPPEQSRPPWRARDERVGRKDEPAIPARARQDPEYGGPAADGGRL